MIKKLFNYFSKTNPQHIHTGYISCLETVRAAHAEGLSVCDYVEKEWNQQGQTTLITDRILSHVDSNRLTAACEIGPGTGRYIEKLLERCPNVTEFSIYEVAEDWAKWLVRTYPVRSNKTSGYDLSSDKDNSMDLCTAHGVLVCLDTFHALSYIKEMQRIVRPGGIFAFDYCGESYFDNADIDELVAKRIDYIRFLPKQVLLQTLERLNCEVLDSFELPYGIGKSEYLIVRKK